MSYTIISAIIGFILFNSPQAFSQLSTTKSLYRDSVVDNLWKDIKNHKEIDREIAIKYFHLDSSDVVEENALIEADSSFCTGSHCFAIIRYGAIVNCEYKSLIEYRKEQGVFQNRLLIATSCDYDYYADHTTQTEYRFKEGKLYVYNNYYKIKDEDLVIDKKKSEYKVYSFPSLTLIYKKEASY